MNQQEVLHQIGRAIRARLIDPSEIIPISFKDFPGLLVACSGGPDSTCLLSVLLGLKQDCELNTKVAHFAYGLRGDESKAEFEFIQSLCKKENIEFFSRHLTEEERKLLLKSGLQAKARKLRYDYFQEISEKTRTVITVAHNSQDQVETFFLNLLRGAGLPGLVGMSEWDGKLFRPLLHVSREEIMQYLERHSVQYCVDSSNDELKYKRNRIRHQLLPLLDKLEGANKKTITRTMEHLARENDYLSEETEKLLKSLVREEPLHGHSLSAKGVSALHPALQNRILRHLLILFAQDFSLCSSALVEELREMILYGKEGQKSTIRRNVDITLSRGRLYFFPREDKTYKELVPLNDCTVRAGGFTFQVNKREGSAKSQREHSLYLALSEIEGDLVIRPHKGEKISPAGMEGKKSVSSLLKDKKIPLPFRKMWPILADDRGILWIGGLRRSNLVKEVQHGPYLEIKMTPSVEELVNR